MKKREASNNRMKIILLILLMMLVLVVGTYAWFTLTHVTTTNTVTTKTGQDDINLYISTTGGDDFKKSHQVDLPKIAENKVLMPESTVDLKTFICSPSSPTTAVSNFAEDTNETYYYRTTVYIKAESTQSRPDSTLDLYLDQGWYSDNSTNIVTAVDGTEILNAARVGMSFDDASPVIMYISDDHKQGGQKTTTIIDGKVVPYGNVLTKQGGKIVAVPDPAVKADVFKLDTTVDVPTIPDKAIFSMQFNKIYKLNIYFYLEGCDEDCSEDIQTQEIDLQLAFYGVLK